MQFGNLMNALIQFINYVWEVIPVIVVSVVFVSGKLTNEAVRVD